MRVLITGAGGQLGRELALRFADHEVHALDRTKLDLGERSSILDAVASCKPDVIVAAGAYTAVDKAESEHDLAIRINCLGTRHLVEAAEKNGSRILYVSTDYVFDGTLDRPYDEWDTTNPQSVYGRTKLGGEHELRPQDTIVRTSWVFGRYGANMVKTVLRLIESHPKLAFVNDQHGKPTCAEDLALMIETLVVNALPGMFHVTNQGPTTWFEFVRDVVAAVGEDPDRVSGISTAELQPARPAPRPANSVLDNAALRLQGIDELPHYRESLQRVIKQIQSSDSVRFKP